MASKLYGTNLVVTKMLSSMTERIDLPQIDYLHELKIKLLLNFRFSFECLVKTLALLLLSQKFFELPFRSTCKCFTTTLDLFYVLNRKRRRLYFRDFQKHFLLFANCNF